MDTRFPKTVDVFVAGGGPAGLATAIAARRRGSSVLVVDGAIPPIDKPCGEGLMPDGVEALAQLGISIPEIEAFPFRGIRFLSDGRRAEAAFPRGTALGIRRTTLHRVMVEHASACGVAMLWQTAVTGLHRDGALVGRELVRARWVVGADGTGSRVRRWSKLDPKAASHRQNSLRFAFRRHYRVAPWTDYMELHWGRHSQAYVTPVARQEVCVALISSSPKMRLGADAALAEFPELCARLKNCEYASNERGAVTVTRSLSRVYHNRTVLVGDASGGVDAVTGEGLCLALRQAALLGECLGSGDLARYQKGHRALLRRPAVMAHMMLLMANHRRLRERAMQVFESKPRAFAGLLSMHVGEGSARDHISNGITLGWKLLTA